MADLYLYRPTLLRTDNHNVILGEPLWAASPPQQLLRDLSGGLEVHVEGDCPNPERLGLGLTVQVEAMGWVG